jgi:hypothetical protein
MSKLGASLVLFLAAAFCYPAAAQVTVEVVIDRPQYLSGESIPVAVRITNRSGQKLKLGTDDTWLTFTVENREGSIVVKTDDVPVEGEFDLESSKRAIKHVDLEPYFAIANPGRYLVTASVHIKEWNQDIRSQPKGFDVLEGTRIWEQTVGIPKAPGNTNAVPEIRKYVLQQVNYVGSKLRLYLRVLDEKGTKPYRVYEVGPVVSFSRPQPIIDGQSNLHILYQHGPQVFDYTIFTPEGDLKQRQTYIIAEKRPRLKLDDEGIVTLTGGERIEKPTDFPHEETADEAASKPAVAKPDKEAAGTDSTLPVAK